MDMLIEGVFGVVGVAVPPGELGEGVDKEVATRRGVREPR